MAENLGLKLDQPGKTSQDKVISGKIKDYSLFYGTLENLLMAKDLDSIMEIVQKGLKIIFNVGRVFFFFTDAGQKKIIGDCCHRGQAS